MPKLGWYVDIEWKKCSGSVELACQMREASDHRAYLWVGVSFDLVVLDGSFECGFGIYVKGILEAVVFVKFAASFGLGLNVELGDPGATGDDPGVEIPLTLEATGQIGGRVKIGSTAAASLTGTSGVRLKGAAVRVSRDGGVSCGGEVEWMGLETRFKASATADVADGRTTGSSRPTTGGAGTRAGLSTSVNEDELPSYLPQVPPSKIYDWSLTGYEPRVPLTPREVEQEFERVFDASWLSAYSDIRVRGELPPALFVPLLPLEDVEPTAVGTAPARVDNTRVDAARFYPHANRPTEPPSMGPTPEPLAPALGPAEVAAEVARAVVRRAGRKAAARVRERARDGNPRRPARGDGRGLARRAPLDELHAVPGVPERGRRRATGKRRATLASACPRRARRPSRRNRRRCPVALIGHPVRRHRQCGSARHRDGHLARETVA